MCGRRQRGDGRGSARRQENTLGPGRFSDVEAYCLGTASFGTGANAKKRPDADARVLTLKLECSHNVLTSPAKRREGDRAPKSARWRGRARGRALRRTLTVNRARALRKSMSDAEVILWSRLHGRHSDRPTFRRQHPMGSMILDFYCPRARLAIEVDGATHWDDEAQAKDAARDLRLEQQGVRVMRIPASRVYRDLGAVVDAIFLRAEELIAAEAPGRRLAPSTPRSSAGEPASAGGPPPAASRGR